ncbi:hypothetical protein GOV09_03370 [Candidatus Woesearchaeota archaeon]|nr:hypothetical protein [Candidatus Woesearchaeota archaeon]
MSIEGRRKGGERKKKVIRGFLDTLEKQHISRNELIRFLHDDRKSITQVPVSLFSCSLSPLQALVKYLKERSLSYLEISRLLGRDERTIWNSFRQAQSKHPSALHPEKSKYSISIVLFRDRSLSILEHLCEHLYEYHGLSYHGIALLLGKDDRTIWTVCKRAERKRNE